ncbi:hypothetical protein GF327_07360 [Candidatus Woesearchaeota archaeon]|nr:hypothetical protein [Candidatus Woesearchaeota archaeon]
MNIEYKYIRNKKELSLAYTHLNQCSLTGVDIECENNFHHYGAYISLIQISSEKKNYVIDVLALENIGFILNVLKNPGIEKIFHGSDFDLRMLYTEYECRVKNIFDTQIAAQFLGINEIGLGSLLEKFLDIKKKDRFQKADWTKRPLTKNMLDYAAKDSIYLIRLSQILKKKLRKKNMLDWVKQESEYIAENDLVLSQPVFWNLKGIKRFTDTQRAVLKRLYDLREKMAKKVNRPVHYIMSSKKLKNLAKEPPQTVKDWKNLKRVHPIVKKKHRLFSLAVKNGLQEKLEFPEKKYMRFTPKQRSIINKLDDYRKKAAEKIGIEPFLLLSKDQIKEIVIKNSFDCLRPWQKKIISEHINIKGLERINKIV